MFGWLKRVLSGGDTPPRAAPFGLGGHGLLLSLSTACHVRFEPDGSAVVQSRETGRTLRVVPGTEPATSAPTEDGEGWSTGAGGPRLLMDPGAKLADVVLRVDVGLGPGAWSLLLGGVWLDSPVGFTVFTRDGELTTTELHLGLHPEDGAFLSFALQRSEPRAVQLSPAADQVRVGRGDEPVRWEELSYVRGGHPWRQRFYLLGRDGGTLLLRAQAPDVLAQVMWNATEQVLRSLEG